MSDAADKRHMARVAEYGQTNGCVVCGQIAVHVHHVLEGRTPGARSGNFCTIPLCYECHQGKGGIHGTRERWSLNKANELEKLNEVIKGIYGGRA